MMKRLLVLGAGALGLSLLLGALPTDVVAQTIRNITLRGGWATPSDDFANPTNAVAVWSLNGCWDGSTWDRCPISDGGAGAVTANTGRMTLASDDPAVTSLQLLDNAVSGSGFNITQMNGVNVSMGNGAAGTGVQRVTEATDSQLSADVALIKTAAQLIDDAQTGDSVHYRTSAGTTEDETEIKGTAGRLFSVAITNTNAAVRYFRCYNLTAANTTPGTSTVFIGLAVPGATTGAGFTHTFGPNGIAFSTALTCTLTTGAADSDVAEVAANEIKWVISYK